MGTVLGLLQSAPATDLSLKMDILKVDQIHCGISIRPGVNPSILFFDPVAVDVPEGEPPDADNVPQSGRIRLRHVGPRLDGVVSL